MTINGVEVDRDTLDRREPLPGDQGWCIVLGDFAQGQKVDFEWLLEAGSLGGGSRLALGVFRDRRLTQRTVFATLDLDTYQKYPGTGSAIV
jgi:hypothetical protein